MRRIVTILVLQLIFAVGQAETVAPTGRGTMTEIASESSKAPKSPQTSSGSSKLETASTGKADDLSSSKGAWQTKAPREEREKPSLSLDLKFLGGPLGTFIDEPSEAKKLTELSNGTQVRIPYSGFGGLGYSLGVTLGLTYDGFIGVETGLFSRNEKATASYNINGGSYDIEVSQKALTVPLLLRLTLPTTSVQPSLLFGMAMHFPSETELESLNLVGLSAKASNYKTLNFGFELEFRLPSKTQDIRIPLSLRGYHNQSLGESAGERIVFSNCDASGGLCDSQFITEWQWAAEVLLGVSWHTQLLD